MEQNQISYNVPKVFGIIEKSQNYKVKYGKAHVMVYRYHSIRIYDDFDEKIGGYDSKNQWFYLSQVFVKNNNAEEHAMTHNFTFRQNGNGHSYWVTMDPDAESKFQRAIEAITDNPFE